VPEGAAKFHSAFQQIFSEHAETSPVLDWGYVDSEGLHTHVFPHVIPHTQYGWLRGTFLRPMDMTQTSTPVSSGGDPPHTHDVPMPPQFTPALANDILLVVWIGPYAVVLGVVVASLGIADRL
jgi:hypothetical protein